MVIDYEKIYSNKAELEGRDRTNVYEVAGLVAHVLCNYKIGNTENFYEMLQYLMGEYQKISPMDKARIDDRMKQNGKFEYIGKSYFVGTSPENNYSMPNQIQVEVEENLNTTAEAGYKRINFKSGGADSARTVLFRLAKDGNYYLWSDSILALLADIKAPEKENPWA